MSISFRRLSTFPHLGFGGFPANLLPKEDSASSTPPIRTGFERVPALDGLRGLAIIAVMLYHFSSGSSVVFNFFAKTGWVGVDLFFVLSGFLITGNLLATKGSPRFLMNFYARRSLRIFPLYYGVVALLVIVLPSTGLGPFLGLDVSAAKARQSEYWLYWLNFGILVRSWPPALMGHFWSLDIEEHFYLLWPVVVRAFSGTALVRICALTSGAVALLRFVLIAFRVSWIANCFLTPCRIDSLLIGSCLALLLTDSTTRALLMHKWRRRILLGSAVPIVAIYFWHGGFLMDDWPVRSLGYTLLAGFGTGLVLYCVDPESNPLRQVLSNNMLRQFGKYSYSLYVFHLLLNHVWDTWFSPTTLKQAFGSEFLGMCAHVLLSILASFGVSFISWHIYEKHFLKFKRHFA